MFAHMITIQVTHVFESVPGLSILHEVLAEIRHLRFKMSATDDAMAALSAKIDETVAEEEKVLAYLQGVPDLIKTAVADALNTSGGNAGAMAAQLTQFANTLGAETQKVGTGLGAAPAETPPPPPPAPLAITTTSLADGTVGDAYTASIATSGGVGPVTITATGLPDGLSMATDGTIIGTPTTAADSTVDVNVTDAATPSPASASATLSLTVS